jgi:hypothetical protein
MEADFLTRVKELRQEEAATAREKDKEERIKVTLGISSPRKLARAKTLKGTFQRPDFSRLKSNFVSA